MSNLLSAKAPGEMPWHGWQTVDPSTLEPFYSKWVGLLTSEGLHAKADIATVLAMLDAHASALAEQVERLTEYWGMPNAYTGGIAAWIEGEHDKDKRMSTFYREKWKAADQRATDWEIAWKYADQRAGRMAAALRDADSDLTNELSLASVKWREKHKDALDAEKEQG